LKKRGILRSTDNQKISQLTQQIADCDAAIAKLQKK